MPTVNFKQPSFGGGVLSPQALGRSDIAKYAIGLRTCSNAWVTRYGTIENRPGTQFCVEVQDSTQKVRLVPFVFSSAVSYELEFGNNYVRPLKLGARISVVGAAAYAGGTTYAIGALVTYAGIVYYSRVAGNVGHQPDISLTQWYPQDGLLEIPTDLPQAALATFQYAQVNDILTIASQSIAPRELQRTSDTQWAWVPFVQSTGIDPPTGVTAGAGRPPAGTVSVPTGVVCTGGFDAGGALPSYNYVVTGWTAGSESAFDASHRVGARIQARLADPIVVSWSATGDAIGYAVYRSLVGSSTTFYLVALVPAGTLTYSDDGTLPAAAAVRTAPTGTPGFDTMEYVVTAISAATGIESLASSSATCVGSFPNSTSPNVIGWTAVAGASKYNVYRYFGGAPGFVGQTAVSPFSDTGFVSDTSIQPPAALPLFATANDYPGVIGYYQQRLFFANTLSEPQTVWGSRTGLRTAFTVSVPTADADALQFTVFGRQVQPVQALVDLGKLVVHTANAEYIATGDQSGALTPSSIGLIANGSSGSTGLLPLVLGNTDLFVQQGATRLLDLRYEVQSFSYAGKDLTKIATGLFAGRMITDLAWQKLPHSIVWCVLDDGTIAGLTYVREDELWAWHVHSTKGGFFEAVIVVPEGTKQTVYVVVRRTALGLGGADVRYIERLATRDCLDTVLYSDAVFVDAALTYDGRNTGSTTIEVFTDSGGFTASDTFDLVASAPIFAAGDVGNTYVFTQTSAATGLVTDRITFTVYEFTNTTAVKATVQRNLPQWVIAVPLATWGKGVTSFSGMDHLAHASIAVLADGDVVADPNDDAYPVIALAGGAFTLTRPAVVVTAGLPVQTDIQTLPLENAQGETIANRRITVRRATPIFHASRGGLFGQDEDHLNAWKQRVLSSDGFPIAPFTGPASVPIQGTPQTTGQVWIRNTNPLPFGLSGIVVTADIADAG